MSLGIISVFILTIFVLTLSVLSTLAKAALYHYAITGESPVVFNDHVLKQAFSKKVKRTPTDFESVASANSATRPSVFELTILLYLNNHSQIRQTEKIA